MPDFTPQLDSAATHASNAVRSLESLRKLLLQTFPADDIRVKSVELAIAEIKSCRYSINGDTTGMFTLQLVPSALEGEING